MQPLRLDTTTRVQARLDVQVVMYSGKGSGRHLFWRVRGYVVHEWPDGDLWACGSETTETLPATLDAYSAKLRTWPAGRRGMSADALAALCCKAVEFWQSVPDTPRLRVVR